MKYDLREQKSKFNKEVLKENMNISDIRAVNIKINGIIRDFEIVILPNEHAKARVTYEVPHLEYSEKDLFKLTEINAMYVCDNSILFSGKCQECSIKRDSIQKVDILNIKLISHTIDLDKEKKSCSFQDCTMSYEQIMRQVLKKDERILNYQCEPIYGNAPLIQYHETAWEFIRRMASRMNTVIYPGYKESEPRISVGLRLPEEYQEMEVLELKKVFCEVFWQRRDIDTNLRRDDFVGYDITSYKDFDIGNGVVLENKKLFILEKRMCFSNDEIIFHYRIGKLPMVVLHRYDNQKFSGMSVRGNVLSVTKETVRLKFDFDKEQEIAKAYDYPWMPETGNAMYLMPQVGTIVHVYFKNAKEESAVVINCVRENGTIHGKLTNGNEKYLTDETGKQMFLKEKSLGFVNERTEDGITVNDESPILASSQKCISLVSAKNINLEANTIYIETPNEVLGKKVRL